MIILKILLCIILALVLCIGIPVACNAPTNKKAMNEAIETVMETLNKHTTVTEVDCGAYRTMKINGIMNFRVKQYDVKEIGNLAVMTVNLGLMQMVTLVLTPVEKDLPLVSMDYMYILKNRKCYLEFYDLVLNKEGTYPSLLDAIRRVRLKHQTLTDVTPTSAWYDTLKTEGIYKSGTRKDDAEFTVICKEGFEEVLQYASTLPVLEDAQHREKAKLQKTYSDGLIANGGVSTDAFVKSLGAEKTKDFFDRVFFRAE